MTVLFDAENIQLRTWYKRAKQLYISQRTSAYSGSLAWNIATKIAYYCKLGAKQANRDWNQAVNSIVLEGSGKNHADDAIVNFVSTKHITKTLILVTSDKDLVERVAVALHKRFPKRTLVVYYRQGKHEDSRYVKHFCLA